MAAASTRARYHRELPHSLGNRETLALLQRRRAPVAVDQLGTSSGRELDRETRAAIGPRLAGVTGHGALEREADAAAAGRAGPTPRPDGLLGPVRIHTDERAQRSAAQLGARAFTIGADVYFGRDEYRPHTAEGRELLAHELAHVIQQERRGQRLIQCKKYALDPAKPGGDQVEAATEAEAKEARAIYERIVVTYGIDFDSAGAVAAQDKIYQANRPPIGQLDLGSYRQTSVVAWTLAELKELERALARYRSLVVLASPSDAVRVGPRVVGRVDRPARKPPVMKPELAGEVTELHRITLFDAMNEPGVDRFDVMVHELGHVFFRGLAHYFAMLPFWVLFPEGKDPEAYRADHALYQKIWAHLQTLKLPPGSIDWRPAFEAPTSEYGFKNPGEDVAEAVTYYVVHELIRKDGLMQKHFPFRYAIVHHAWGEARKVVRTTDSIRKGP